MSDNSMIVKYGTFEIDFAAVPHTSLVAMLRRGVSHYFGSEQASKVTGKYKPNDAGELAEGVIDTPENRATDLTAFREKALENLLAGTVGVSTRGPQVDPVEKIARGIARKEVQGILAAHNVKWPKKAEDTVSLPDGSKVTADQLIDRRLAKEGDRIMKEAKKIADQKAREAKKAAEAASAEGLAGLI